MSICPDNWIRNACKVPKHFVRTYNKAYYSYDDMETLRKQNIGIDPYNASYLQIRPVTDVEVAVYKPMISPFVDEQVKQIQRPLTTNEKYRKLAGEPVEGMRQDALGNAVITDRVISYGLSSFGYDVRIAREFKIFTNINSTVIDPKRFDTDNFVDFVGDVCIIPPNSFVLARSIEYFCMPNDTTGLVLGKSTYARCGISCLATPLEAGWEGHITLEFANTTPLPAMLYANEGAAQVLFLQGPIPDVTYRDRGGKYQGQTGITLPKA